MSFSFSYLSTFVSDVPSLALTINSKDFVKSYPNNNSIDDVKTNVDSVYFTQSNDLAGLGNVFIRINLGRTYRLGQTVVLKGAIDSLFINNTTPLCSFMIVNNSSSYDDASFYDEISSGAYYIDSCKFGNDNGDNFTITLTTKNYLSTNTKFSNYILIKLSPIYVRNLSKKIYSISTYLGSLTTSTISNKNSQSYFPETYIDSSNKIKTYNSTGLCDLTDMFPRIPSTKGQLTFTISLSNTSEIWNEYINTETINKSTSWGLNEVSIFMDSSIYMRNENIWCSYNSSSIPCTWTIQGYINVYFALKLFDGETEITIYGIIIPQINTDVSNSNNIFHCSVNYFQHNVRKNLIVGLGSNNISSYTPTSTGNIIQYLSDSKKLASTTQPRSKGDFYFKFNLNESFKLKKSSYTLEAISDDANPIILVAFPEEFDFRNIKAINNMKAKLTMTSYSVITVSNDFNWNHESKYTSFSKSINIDISEIEIKGNYLIITLGLKSLYISEEVAYFDLILFNISTPNIETQESKINLYMMNDLKDATVIFSTYSNLNNAIGNQIGFNDYYQGPSFSFTDSNLALIEASSYDLKVKQGRYIPLSFTLTGGKNDASTNISLLSNKTIKSLDSNILLDNGLNTAATIRIGVSCGTSPGSYWADFTLKNSIEGFYSLRPVRLVVSPIANNKNLLYINNQSNVLSNILTYHLSNRGFTEVFINSEYPVVDDVTINVLDSFYPNNLDNDKSFKFLSSDRINIVSGNISSYFSLTIDVNEIPINQYLTISSSNKCFGFQQSTSDVTIEFIINDSFTDLTQVNISSMFVYDRSSESQNEINIIFSPIAYSKAVFALVCAESDYPTYATATSNIIADLKSPLYKFHSQLFYDTTKTYLSFKNLQRNTSYKLKVWMSNLELNSTSLISYETKYLPLSKEEAFPVYLKTNPYNKNIYVKITSNIETDSSFNKILLDKTQNYINTIADKATLYVLKAKNGEVDEYPDGYSSVAQESCISNYFELNFNATQNISDPTKEESSDSSSSSLSSPNNNGMISLRNLEEIDSTLNTSNNKEYYFYLIFKQSVLDSVTVNIDYIVNKYVGLINDSKSLTKFMDVDSKILKNIGLKAKTEVDRALSTSDFSLKDIKYNNVTGNISFIAIADYNITCDWKLNNNSSLSINVTDFSNCEATDLNCGKINFIINNKETSNYNTGLLGTNSYYIYIYCKNNIPQSTNYIIFKYKEAIEVIKSNNDIASNSDMAADCLDNPLSNGCNNMSYYLKLSAFIILVNLLFV